ncbi:MAG TPA: CSLREA domain-containing protein, partial [Symbiobacteriaceae bacterium]|nr:CSLREA domain-containing protein [Symbiobacteriaceae bacterium]
MLTLKVPAHTASRTARAALSVLAAVSMVAAALIAAPPVAYAATYNVTSTVDAADGVCDANCTLREAILAANANPGQDLINVPAGTYTLTVTTAGDAGGDLDIRDGVIIRGAGPTSTIIQAGTDSTNGIDRVMQIELDSLSSNLNAVIENVTIRYGRTDAAGQGGAINYDQFDGVSGTLTIRNSIITQNWAGRRGGGIAAYNSDYSPSALVTIEDTEVSANTSGKGVDTADGQQYGGLGGGLEGGYLVRVVIERSEFINNITDDGKMFSGDGAGINLWDDGGASSYIRDSIISGNDSTAAAGNGRGGGLFTGRPLTITNTTISGNQAGSFGGGLVAGMLDPDTLTLANVTISGNTAQKEGGGVFLALPSTGNPVVT